MNSPADNPDPAGNGQSNATVTIGALEPTPRPADRTLEMRQVAGLTAGSVMVMREGSFQFRESNKEVGFSLVVEPPDLVTVVGGTALTGGYGSTFGAAIGAVIMAMSVQGIPSSRWNSDWRFVFLGGILLTAVIANNFIRSKAEATR